MNFPGAALFASSRGGVFHHLAVSVVSCVILYVCVSVSVSVCLEGQRALALGAQPEKAL